MELKIIFSSPNRERNIVAEFAPNLYLQGLCALESANVFLQEKF